MRIRIEVGVPVEPRHGIKIGNEYEVAEEVRSAPYNGVEGRLVAVWIVGADGERVKLHKREYLEIV